MTTEVIRRRFWQANQSWHFEIDVQVNVGEYGTLRTYILRVNIERNAYDNQSGIRGSFLTESGWEQLVFEAMTKDWECHAVSYTAKSPDRDLFEKDANHVIKYMTHLLEGLA